MAIIQNEYKFHKVNRIFGLDLARAGAIALVVLAHAHQGSQEIGIYGVELFFALSGFLIGGILYRCVPEEGRWNLAGVMNFWQRRWWRTLPAYYLFLVVAVIHHGLRGEAPEGGWGALFSYLFFVPNLMSPNEVFYDVSWSLCIEEAFYLLFPLVVLVIHRISESRKVAFLGALLLFAIVPPLLREWAFLEYPASQARVMTLPRLDAIAFGVAMAVAEQVFSLSSRQRWGLATIGGVLLMGTVFAHFLSRPIAEAEGFFRGALATMPLAFALCMPLLGRWNALPGWLERIRPVVTTISLWSYSIYLSHHMILMAVVSWFGESREGLGMKLLAKVIGLILVFVVSHFVYRHFETRFTRRRPAERHCADPSRKAPRTVEA